MSGDPLPAGDGRGRARLAGALAVALASAALAYLRLTGAGVLAADFTWAWRGAQILLAGQNPYALIRPEGAYPFNDFLYYPLPALLIAAPLAWLSGPLAGAIFIGLSSGLLCWGLLRDGSHRLILFASPPYLYALISAQWAPLITAAALLPGLAFALAAKPNLGLPVLVAYPTRRRLLLFGATVAASLIVLPSWPMDLAGQISSHLNYVPLISWYGPLVLLALPFWRAAPARLLLAMAIMPQRLLYDQLALWLIPQTPRQSLLLTLAAWAGVILGLALGWGEAALVCTYLPALGCVLWERRAQIRGWGRRAP
ncbi:hypothetical protein K2Z83_25630 [Oscillochloris sp. ZM17-4]|uniref:hypothetical protein n=1 Tax=Oscillochloris sp. ZM17-4 TaxID=2866714 RepID=UPI001C72AC0E|nr:hypothetical protein [Oscillochloris sp. ZM17-4]MBX0331038.1 hypothetical protein [Oscillochloris sp. ZM17-4]